uniref:CCHC-type domain-containing protein n=1 Tax=Setaria italica TaxID=4555 RepID=K3YZS8_SETIT
SISSNDKVELCLMAKEKKKKDNKGERQKIELPSSLVKELQLLKSEHASLVCKYDSLANDYACATESLSCVASLEKANEVLIAQLEKLTSEHMDLKAIHKELECSHEKLVESYAILHIAHEVIITSVKSIQTLSHTCSCSQVNVDLSCTKICCSQATQSSIEHVFVESCNDLIAQEKDELIQEAERLKKDLSELKGKSQVQPSHDNCEIMVKKLEKGSTVTYSAPQLHLKISKSKIQEKNKFEHVKCFNCSKMGHFASTCSTKLKGKEALSKRQRSLAKKRGHMGKDCTNGNTFKSNLVHYNFSKLRNHKVGTYAIRVTGSP